MSETTKDKKETAKKLLSKYLTEISQEPTEAVMDATGETRIATKAEALARLIWDRALGLKEEKAVIKDGKKIGMEVVEHKPDKTFIAMIMDRTEGRTPLITDKDKSKKATVSKISEQLYKRINSLADKQE